MSQWNMLYDMYERRLKAELSNAAVPKHIGVILDGNRRWAKSLGATASQGHRAGAGKISEFLQWSDDAGVSIVTLWLLSTDNLSRDADELGELLRIICEAVSLLADQRRWKLAIVGDLSRHNLRRMLGRGVLVTVNSDDPAYFGGYLNQNFIELADALDLNETDIRTLCKNSFKASFLNEEEKAKRYAEIDSIHV